MTVLLIDAAGNKREWQISQLMPSLLVPLPQHVSATMPDAADRFIRPTFSVVRFELSDELSYPPVYRFACVETH